MSVCKLNHLVTYLTFQNYPWTSKIIVYGKHTGRFSSGRVGFLLSYVNLHHLSALSFICAGIQANKCKCCNHCCPQSIKFVSLLEANRMFSLTGRCPPGHLECLVYLCCRVILCVICLTSRRLSTVLPAVPETSAQASAVCSSHIGCQQGHSKGANRLKLVHAYLKVYCTYRRVYSCLWKQ